MNKQKMEKYSRGLGLEYPLDLWTKRKFGFQVYEPFLPSRLMAEQCLKECFFYREEFKKIESELGMEFWRIWKWRHRELFPEWNPPAKAFNRIKNALEGYTIAGKPASQWCNV
jgi:hypothetical protein